MKNLFAGLLVSGSIIITQAQLTNAVLALENKEYKVAKESIDKYMLKEKSATDAKGWYYKGSIYYDIAFSSDEAVKALEKKVVAIKTSAEAYNKSILNDKPKGEWAEKSKPFLDNLWGNTFNESIDKYKNNDFAGSLEFIKVCQMIKPKDTLAFTTGALIAMQAKDYKTAKETYEGLLAIDYKPKSLFKNLFYIVLVELKDTTSAFKVVGQARSLFPEDKDFLSQEINLYIETKRQQEAINKLNEAVKADPANAKVYLYNLGIIYKQSNDNVKARGFFQQSLAKDSLYEGANYMYGYMIMEDGDFINKKINNMTLKEFNMNGKKEEAKRDAMYKKAIPYLEKAYRVSKDEALKKQLTTLYTKFKMDAKLKDL
ncbi:MAG: hypothetical protein SFY32_14595 [Bacteroidota bacterium]|nr:hypothetical protein [Bacteroidota bacterium]